MLEIECPRFRRFVTCTSAAAGIACTSATSLGQASFHAIGDLVPSTHVSSEAWAISADGDIVAGDCVSLNGSNEAFTFSEPNSLTGLGDLPTGDFGSWARGISADGSVVVGESYDLLVVTKAFRWTDASGMVSLGALPSTSNSSTAFAVSDDGAVIVGTSGIQSFGNYLRAFKWTESEGMVAQPAAVGQGTLIESAAYGVSADGSAIVGYQINHNHAQVATLWQPGVKVVSISNYRPNDGYNDIAYDITPDGAVVVGTMDPPGAAITGQDFFRWSKFTGMVNLGDLDGGDHGGYAYGVSADGEIIVGRGRNADQDDLAVIWDSINGLRVLKDVLENEYGLDLTGWTLVEATGISDNGERIVGWGTNPQGATEAFLAVIPRPNSCPADLDGSGGVDSTDLAMLLSNFGTTSGATHAQGDLDGDGDVDSTDLSLLLTAFGNSCPA